MTEINSAAIIQGVVAAVAVVGIIVLYVDRMGKISKDISSISNSIDDIETTILQSDLERVSNNVNSVNLEEMERTINKLETYLDMELSDGYTPSGTNSVVYDLNDISLTLTISYIGDPDWHNKLNHAENNWNEGVTVFSIEFDRETDTHGIFGLLTQDEELEKIEYDLFGDEAIIDVRSPYKMVCGVNTGDFQLASDWIVTAVNKIEESELELRNKNQEFDRAVSDNLDGAKIKDLL
jgi:hypothetical protein